MTKTVPISPSTRKVVVTSRLVDALLRKVKNGASSVLPLQPVTVCGTLIQAEGFHPDNNFTNDDKYPSSDEQKNFVSRNRDDCNIPLSPSTTGKSCCSCDDVSDTSSAIARDLSTITNVYEILLQEPRRRQHKQRPTTIGNGSKSMVPITTEQCLMTNTKEVQKQISKKRSASASLYCSGEKRNRVVPESPMIGMEIQAIAYRVVSSKDTNKQDGSSDAMFLQGDDKLRGESVLMPSCSQGLPIIDQSKHSLRSDTLDDDANGSDIDDDDDDDDTVSAISMPNELPTPNDVTDYIRNCIVLLNDELSNVNDRHERYNQKFWNEMKEIEMQQNIMRAELEKQQLRLNLEQQLLQNELLLKQEQPQLVVPNGELLHQTTIATQTTIHTEEIRL